MTSITFTVTISPELLKAVAKAICTVDEQNGGPPWEWLEARNKKVITEYYEKANAAILTLKFGLGNQ